jgi:hypothetical protein
MRLSSEGYQIFDTDFGADVQALYEKSPTGSSNEVWKRDRIKYGYGSNRLLKEYGIPALEAVDYPPSLLDPSEYKDAIVYAHEQQTMPMYYTYLWRPKGFKYTQNGIGYCWTWSGCGGIMTTRALEDKDLIYLAPVSMGYLVGWADRGNYLASFIKGAREDGVCWSTDNSVLNDHRRSSSLWPMGGDRELVLLDEVWDLNDGNMIQQCVTCLCAGRSIYIAYNWWGHALELVGLRYNGSTLEWIISNSHNEADFIILTGSRATPSEAIAFVSTKSTTASAPQSVLYTGA